MYSEFFIACILLALEDIHSYGVIHKDIKPDNIIVDKNGYVRLSDFGFASHIQTENQCEINGTLEYMPPEILKKEPLSYTVDYFSIGIILYELMFGYRPYHSNSEKELISSRLTQSIKVSEITIPKDWNSHVCTLINGLLIINPRERLGANKGITEIKSHPWFKGFQWNKLKQFKLKSPFIPIVNDNSNKCYYERNECIGTNTMERFKEYIKNDSCFKVFDDYSYVNTHIENKKTHFHNTLTSSDIIIKPNIIKPNISSPDFSKRCRAVEKCNIESEKTNNKGTGTIVLPLIGNSTSNNDINKKSKLLKIRKYNCLNKANIINNCFPVYLSQRQVSKQKIKLLKSCIIPNILKTKIESIQNKFKSNLIKHNLFEMN